MLYKVHDISYDTGGQKIDLPKTMEIEVPDDFDDEEVICFIIDEISDRTGYCHFGFSTTPNINE